MNVIVEQIELPETGMVRIQVDTTVDIRISADVAQRLARLWVHEHVSTLIATAAPTLALTDSVVWRVPITFAATPDAYALPVGSLDVDVETGEIVGAAAENQDTLPTSARTAAQQLIILLPANQQP